MGKAKLGSSRRAASSLFWTFWTAEKGFSLAARYGVAFGATTIFLECVFPCAGSFLHFLGLNNLLPETSPAPSHRGTRGCL